MRRLLPLLLLFVTWGASATGILNILLGGGAQPASFSGTLVVGNDGMNFGYSTMGGDAFGSLTPHVDTHGLTISNLYNVELGPPPPPNQVTVQIVGASYYNYFNSITIPGLGTFTSSPTNFNYTAGVGSWTFITGSDTITNGVVSYH